MCSSSGRRQRRLYRSVHCARARGTRHLGKILTLNQDLRPNMLQWFWIVFVWRYNASANWFGWVGWSTNNAAVGCQVNRIRAVFKFSSADPESSDGLVHFCSSHPANVGWPVQSAVAQSSNFEFYIFKMSLPVLPPLIRVAYTMRSSPPKFSSVAIEQIFTAKENSLALTCPAQSSPSPAFRYFEMM